MKRCLEEFIERRTESPEDALNISGLHNKSL